MKIGTGPYSLFRRFFWIFGILSGSMGFYENPSDTVRSFGVCHISDNQKSLSVDPSQSLFYFVPQPSRLCYFSARTNRQNNYIHGVFLTDSQLGAPVRKFKTFYLSKNTWWEQSGRLVPAAEALTVIFGSDIWEKSNFIYRSQIWEKMRRRRLSGLLLLPSDQKHWSGRQSPFSCICAGGPQTGLRPAGLLTLRAGPVFVNLDHSPQSPVNSSKPRG